MGTHYREEIKPWQQTHQMAMDTGMELFGTGRRSRIPAMAIGRNETPGQEDSLTRKKTGLHIKGSGKSNNYDCQGVKDYLKKERLMSRKEHHVVHNPSGGWDVKRNGAERVSVHTDTKKEAIDSGRKISQNQGTEFIIHNIDGKISGSDSHGNDPCSPKDQR